VATFYIARSEIITPLPWSTFALPFSQANAALYIVAITRMRNHEATRSYVVKRIAQGKTKREIIRCLKRYIVREIYQHLCVHTDAKCAA
jgi:transposase